MAVVSSYGEAPGDPTTEAPLEELELFPVDQVGGGAVGGVPADLHLVGVGPVRGADTAGGGRSCRCPVTRIGCTEITAAGISADFHEVPVGGAGAADVSS